MSRICVAGDVRRISLMIRINDTSPDLKELRRLLEEAKDEGRREMYAEVMRVVGEYEDSEAGKYLEGDRLSLWQRTVDAILDALRALEPDADSEDR